MEQALQEIFEVLKPDTIKFNKNSLTRNGERMTFEDFSTFIRPTLSDESVITLVRVTPFSLFEIVKKDYIQKTFKEIDMESGTPIESPPFPPLIPTTNIENGGNFLLTGEGKVSRIDYKCWFDSLSKDTKMLVPHSRLFAVEKYVPFGEESEDIIVDGAEFKQINTYVKAPWMRLVPFPNPGGEVVEDLPEEIQKFFGHLFIDPDSLDYVLDWIYYMLTSRMEVALVLNGAKGVGKGIVNMLDTNFNSDFMNTRLMEFDELKITKKRVNHLKLYFNDDLSLEVKGVDGGVKMQNHNSFYISANGASDLYIESDDRRFSVIKVTDRSLLKVFSAGEINDLIGKLSSSESDILLRVGRYILNRGTKLNYGKINPYRTDRFFELVENSLAGWQKYIIQKTEANTPISSVRKFYDRRKTKYPFPESDTPVIDFLRNYRGIDGERFAEVVDGEIIINNDTDELYL